ncbi:hypothetical protein FS749_004574 [Ceratobasidium sp. UAMH 11750]|nr:hypothetical protein FS749_004574 [Ceratobasidium sp. UAMH 11750]
MQKLKPRPPSFVLSNTAILSLLLSHIAQATRTDDSDSSTGVIWVRPSSTDVYVSGDKMVVAWSSRYGSTSPSFQLCLSDTQECGEAVWPNVKRLSNGTYSLTMWVMRKIREYADYDNNRAIPELRGDNAFFIRMEDDDGDISDTPMFKLQASSNQSDRTSLSDSPSSSSSTTPDSSSSSRFGSNSPSSGGGNDGARSGGGKDGKDEEAQKATGKLNGSA